MQAIEVNKLVFPEQICLTIRCVEDRVYLSKGTAVFDRLGQIPPKVVCLGLFFGVAVIWLFVDGGAIADISLLDSIRPVSLLDLAGAEQIGFAIQHEGRINGS